MSWRTSSIESLLVSSVDGPFGSNLKTEHYVAEPGVRLVRLQNIGSGVFLDAEKSWIAESHARRLAKHDVQPGDVLVASLGDPTHPFARSCLYPMGHAPGIVKADCFRLRTNDELEGAFLAGVLNTPRWRSGLVRFVNRSGVSRDRVNLGKLRGYEIPVPPLSEQRAVMTVLNTAENRVAVESQYIEKLRLFKQGLMHDLLTGYDSVASDRVTTRPIDSPQGQLALEL